MGFSTTDGHLMRVTVSSRIMARTTVDIDASVLRGLKRRATREGKTLGRLMSELLAGALERAEEHSPAPFTWTTSPMRAMVDLEDKEAVRRATGEP
jgi:hypothetical protein